MRKALSTILITLLTVMATGCSKKSTENISYKIANGYFVNNDVTEIPNKITTQETFDKTFGYAAVMGKNGLPTNIDFNKEFVIAVATPITDTYTEIKDKSLEANKDTLTFKYHISKGAKQSWSMQPLLMIIVDKKYSSNKLKLTEE